jgi:hypothetical protein
MTNAIIDKLIKFRTDLFSLFKYRSELGCTVINSEGKNRREWYLISRKIIPTPYR